MPLPPGPFDFDSLDPSFGSTPEDLEFQQRIERAVDVYLRGRTLPILSASLRGPFGVKWRNPWSKAGNKQKCGQNGRYTRREARKHKHGEMGALSLKRLATREAPLQPVQNYAATKRPVTLHLDTACDLAIALHEDITDGQGDVDVDQVPITTEEEQASPAQEPDQALAPTQGSKSSLEREPSQPASPVHDIGFTTVKGYGSVTQNLHKQIPEYHDDASVEESVVSQERHESPCVEPTVELPSLRVRGRLPAAKKPVKACGGCGKAAKSFRPGPAGSATLCGPCGSRWYRQNREKAQSSKILKNSKLQAEKMRKVRPLKSHATIMKTVFPGGIDATLQRLAAQCSLSQQSSVSAVTSRPTMSSPVSDRPALPQSRQPIKRKRKMVFDTPPTKPHFNTRRMARIEVAKDDVPQGPIEAKGVRHQGLGEPEREPGPSSAKVRVVGTPAHMLHHQSNDKLPSRLAEEAPQTVTETPGGLYIDLWEKHTNTVLSDRDVNLLRTVMRKSIGSLKPGHLDTTSYPSPELSTQAAFLQAQRAFQSDLETPARPARMCNFREPDDGEAVEALESSAEDTGVKRDLIETPGTMMPSTQALFAEAEHMFSDTAQSSPADQRGWLKNDDTSEVSDDNERKTVGTSGKADELEYPSFAAIGALYLARQTSQSELSAVVEQAGQLLGDSWSVMGALREQGRWLT